MGTNTLRIFPTSPVPAAINRQPMWNEYAANYDSGARQSGTSYFKPLYKYSIQLSNLPRSKQSSLHNFWNLQRGIVTPFLFEDPYDFRANSVTVLQSGSTATSFYVYDINSFQIIPKSGSTVLVSALSGTLPNSWIDLNQDTGMVVRSGAKATADTWTMSCVFFRKVAFSDQYNESSNIWENFSGAVSFEELI